MISVAIVGPESTGKTTLTQSLAKHYESPWVQEYAREYLTATSGIYKQEDLIEIAAGQLELEKKVRKDADRIVFLDTDLLVIKVWSEFKYGNCDPWITQQLEMNRADLYLLTDYNIPYEDDPLRESPDKRDELFYIYEKQLLNSGSNFQVIKGDASDRLDQSISHINLIL